MKLSEYAKKHGITYRTAFRWWQNGQIKGFQKPSGTIIVTEGEEEAPVAKKVVTAVVIYARVSFPKQKDHLDRQVASLQDSCAAKGYQVGRIVKEIGSGVNDSRRQFLALLADPKTRTMVVEHKDRATRFGFRYLEVLLNQAGRSIEVANLAENNREELLEDLSCITNTASMHTNSLPKEKNHAPPHSAKTRITTKRNRRVMHYLHTASRRIVDLLVAQGIGTLVLGKNPFWKTRVELGKKHNQEFVQIPHAKFLQLLTYKAQARGIRVIVTEESYTSKASFLDLDPLPTYDPTQGAEQEENPRFSGSRDGRWYRVKGRAPKEARYLPGCSRTPSLRPCE